MEFSVVCVNIVLVNLEIKELALVCFLRFPFITVTHLIGEDKQFFSVGKLDDFDDVISC